MSTEVYYIRSSRDPSKFYTVAANPRGFYECDCPAATFYRTRPCKHAEQVRRGCGLAARPKSRTTRGTGRPDYGCPVHTDCGYETAEHLGKGPYGDGYPTRRSQREMVEDFGGREVRA